MKVSERRVYHSGIEGGLVFPVVEFLPVDSFKERVSGELLGILLASQSLFRLTHKQLRTQMIGYFFVEKKEEEKEEKEEKEKKRKGACEPQ
jgi:hypothetical protein